MNKGSWYVLHVLTGNERIVTKRANALPGVYALTPIRVMDELRKGMWAQVERVVIPGYVFVNTNLSAEAYYKLKNIPHVIKMLGAASGKPHPVPPEDMAIIELLANGGLPIGASGYKRQQDGRLSIIGGILAELEPHITSMDMRRRRAKVMVELLGKRHNIELCIRAARGSPAADQDTTSNPEGAQADSSPCDTMGDHMDTRETA